MVKKFLLSIFLILPSVSPAFADSSYTLRLEDAKAVYLAPNTFPVHPDGSVDDSDAIQQAINQVEDTHHMGILFIPEGRYRISKTIYVWPGIRLIGYGVKRPVFFLPPHSPAYQSGPSYMVYFTGARPAAFRTGAKAGAASSDGQKVTPPDANPGTFYSAMSNIDIEIQEGNPGAVGVRARYAQHCYLSHMNFDLGTALAGIHDGGNVAQDLHFYGGQYGIWTRKPSPGWQFTIIDATFEGQSKAAIREHEAGLTLIRPSFKNVPTAIDIDQRYSDELWIRDARMENISGPAIIISNENNPRTEINAENVFCQKVPVFSLLRDSGKKTNAPSEMYSVKIFSHGLHYDDIASTPDIRNIFDSQALTATPAPVKSDILDLPPMDTWVNVRTLGAKGDGQTDDTEALQKAIASHRTIYFPSGQYRVTDTIALKPDTVLIGLHPSTTRLVLLDATPAFQGIGTPKALLETPQGGTNIVTGIGLYTNGVNPRAVATKWQAGTHSMMNDVRFLGGHGTIDPDVSGEEARKAWTQIYNNTHTADADLARRWDGQYPSLWITNGGGGTFVDIWTPSTFAQAGLYVSNTSTEGRIYELSSEHHVRNEAVFAEVSNWRVYALQTEEERGEGGFALPIEIRNSSNILFANLHMYRVVSSFQPYPAAIKVWNSNNISFRNLHCYSDSKVSFDNAIQDETHNLHVRQREISWIDISGSAPPDKTTQPSAIVAAGAHVEKVAGGFYNISGGAVDAAGDIYFVDAKWQTIYRWSPASQRLAKVRDNPLDPVNLAFDKSGNLLVISYSGNGTVYSFKPDSEFSEITLLRAEASQPRPGMSAVLPVIHWRNENDFTEKIPVKKPYQFVSPDRTVFIPAGEDFVNGQLYYGSKIHDVIRAFGLSRATIGQTYYVSDESEEKTYSATVEPDGTLSSLKLFAELGGEGITSDADGNVYIAAGQVLVYNPSGKLIDTIEVPERPTQLLFGGRDGKTLFIAARSSLYAVETQHQGH